MDDDRTESRNPKLSVTGEVIACWQMLLAIHINLDGIESIGHHDEAGKDKGDDEALSVGVTPCAPLVLGSLLRGF